MDPLFGFFCSVSVELFRELLPPDDFLSVPEALLMLILEVEDES